MDPWIKTSLILCVFGFLKEFRPSEPYITQYLVGPTHNFTDEQVNQQIYPVITYSYLAQLILVFLVTDLLRYKLVIVLEGISGVLSLFLLVVGKDVASMQVMSFFVGSFFATEIAYFTYIYAKVDRKHYQKVTSYTQTAFLLGRFTSSVVGQILVSTHLMDYYELNFLTGGAMFIATVWAFFLPSVERSIYFNVRETKGVPAQIETVPNRVKDVKKDGNTSYSYTTHVFVTPSNQNSMTFGNKCVRACGLLWKDFKDAYTNWYIVKCSIWWALAMCGFNQGYFYMQVLWDHIVTEAGGTDEQLRTMYNGGVEAIYTIIAAAASFGSGRLRVNWQVFGESTLATSSLVLGACLIVASHAVDIWVSYLAYIVFGVVYHTMFTIINSEVAKHINEDSYGLIFGVNTFFALVLQTVLTLAVAGEGGLALAIRPQFMVYGGYFLALGAIFAVMTIVSLCSGKQKNQPLWLSTEPATVSA